MSDLEHDNLYDNQPNADTGNGAGNNSQNQPEASAPAYGQENGCRQEPPYSGQNGQGCPQNQGQPYGGQPYGNQGAPYGNDNGYYGYNQGPNQNNYYNMPNQGYPQNGWQQNQYQQVPPKKENNPMAVTSMVLGILSILSCCMAPLSLILPIAGITLAILSKKGKPMNGFAIAGIVLSIVGILFSLAFFAYYMFILTLMKDPQYAAIFNDLLEQYQAIPQ